MTRPARPPAGEEACQGPAPQGPAGGEQGPSPAPPAGRSRQPQRRRPAPGGRRQRRARPHAEQGGARAPRHQWEAANLHNAQAGRRARLCCGRCRRRRRRQRGEGRPVGRGPGTCGGGGPSRKRPSPSPRGGAARGGPGAGRAAASDFSSFSICPAGFPPRGKPHPTVQWQGAGPGWRTRAGRGAALQGLRRGRAGARRAGPHGGVGASAPGGAERGAG